MHTCMHTVAIEYIHTYIQYTTYMKYNIPVYFIYIQTVIPNLLLYNLCAAAALRQERSPRRGARRAGEPTYLQPNTE